MPELGSMSVLLFIAVDQLRIQSPLLARFKLPTGPDAIDIGVKQEDEGISKGCVRVSERAVDVSMCAVVPIFQLCTHLRKDFCVDDIGIAAW